MTALALMLPIVTIVTSTAPVTAATVTATAGRFTISSPDVSGDGALALSATCDGAGLPPTVRWHRLPSGTVSLLLLMDTEPGPPRPGEPTNSGGDYSWTLYDVPATARSTASRRHGLTGHNSHNPELAYAPPCSQGPGLHSYTITVYALSARLGVTPARATGDRLRARARGLILGTATLTVTATRS